MKAWLIDDEQPCVDELNWLLKQYPDIEVVGADTDPARALAFIPGQSPDIVFLDIDMPKIDGLKLALELQEQCPRLMVIFVTAYAQYALEAYKTHPMDFLLKPVRQTRLDDCVSHLRKQYSLLHPDSLTKPSFYVQCFGTFEFQCEPEIRWGTHRVKELFLYLVGRNGSSTSKSELLETLFEGKSDKNTVHNLYMTIYRLKSLLDTLDPERRFIRLTDTNVLSMIPGICDYTDFMCFARENAVINEKNFQEAARVLSLNHGAFLERESFEWAGECNIEADAEYERMALDLGNLHLAAGRLEEAEAVMIELLKHNSLCEEAHTLLLDLALKSGNREAYLIRYEQYARIMKKELRLKPNPYYREQYEKLK